MHVGYSNVLGSPLLLPGTPRVTAKSVWPKAAKQSFVNRSSLYKVSRAGVSLLHFKVISVCSRSLTFKFQRDVSLQVGKEMPKVTQQVTVSKSKLEIPTSHRPLFFPT